MRIAAIALTIIGTLAASPALAQNRFAFVVGNDSYQNVEPLKKAVNDARAVAATMRKLGFQVTLGENLGRREFNEKFSTFESAIQPGDTAFVFYSGHGVDLLGANYLIPVDAPKVNAQQQSLLKDEAISTDNMIQRLKSRGTRSQIVVLDACRENPFKDSGGRSLGGTRGLGATQAVGGVFIAYSAGVGEVALDRLSDNDTNPNSIFTRSFLPLLEDPSRSLISVVKETRLQVKQLASTVGHSQNPAYYDEIDGDLFIAKGVSGGSAPAPVPVLPRSDPPPVAEQPRPLPPVANLPPPAPPVGAKGITPAPADGGGFIFVNSDRVRLSQDDLRNLSQQQLRIARNEIYARKGRYFKDPSLTAHFSKFSWYRPYTWDVSLNKFEDANVKLISSMER